MPCCGGQAFSCLRREVPDCRKVGAWPEPPYKVAHVAHTAGRGEADSQVKGLPSDVACLLRLAPGGVGGGEQGQVEGPAAYVAAVHVQ
jgi:hypothetical protein